jgi:hypothetical protein
MSTQGDFTVPQGGHDDDESGRAHGYSQAMNMT